MHLIAGAMANHRVQPHSFAPSRCSRFVAATRLGAAGAGHPALKVGDEMRKTLITLLLFLTGCVGIPENVKPVDDFKLEKYLGKWYEIARLDHSFDRGLSRVTAEYSLRDDGGVRVLNRGYSDKAKAWKEAEGKAYFVQSPDQGYFKVSFFGPFYGSYIIIDLDQENYQYSLVSGQNKSFLWILARATEITDDIRKRLM
jgi:apolipoprotein D and lipocalin family protein